VDSERDRATQEEEEEEGLLRRRRRRRKVGKHNALSGNTTLGARGPVCGSEHRRKVFS